MVTSSRFETLTNRYVLVQERTQTLISDLRRLVQLLESEIESEEGSTRIFDRANSNYPVAVQKLRTRRDNLIATISQLEENG
ncbi:MAG TPA: hypothetical protein VN682_17695 [Terriglobales bacterium]|jgi:exonuclease VII small subunit|nr:hypothetical protein [Terriglobales bacterium]